MPSLEREHVHVADVFIVARAGNPITNGTSLNRRSRLEMCSREKSLFWYGRTSQERPRAARQLASRDQSVSHSPQPTERRQCRESCVRAASAVLQVGGAASASAVAAFAAAQISGDARGDAGRRSAGDARGSAGGPAAQAELELGPTAPELRSQRAAGQGQPAGLRHSPSSKRALLPLWIPTGVKRDFV